MQQPELSQPQDPLDLLRRFTPTPLKAVYRIGTVRVVVETNDFALLPALRLEAECQEPSRLSLEWKLVRDADASAPLESPVFLSTETLIVVAMGSACILGLDRERRELSGFIGAAVDGHTFQEFLVPHLIHMTNEVARNERKCRTSEWGMESLNA
jgi:hypothetical protein